MLNPPGPKFAMTLEEIRSAASVIANDLRKLTASNPHENLPAGGGSTQRGIPEELRKRFIDLRAALYQRGIFDPVLVRFDSATAPPAPTTVIADALAAAAASL